MIQVTVTTVHPKRIAERKDKKTLLFSPIILIPKKYRMFNIFLSIQSHRKPPLHPKLCPEPGGFLGCCHHSMHPVPVAGSRHRRDGAGTVCCCHRYHRGGRATARQGTRAPGMDPERVSHSHTCGSAGDDCSPSGSTPANAAHTGATETVALGKTGNRFPWFFSTPFSCLAAGPVPGNKTFFNILVLFFPLVLILRFGVDIHPCLTEIPNSQF